MSKPSETIRVAYIVHTFHVGGLERCIARLANHLDRERFLPFIICLGKNSDAADWIRYDDVKIIELNKQPGNDPRVIGKFARQLRKHKIQVVHSHNWGTLLETSLARRLAGVPCHVHAERGMELADLQLRGLRPRLRGMAMRWALNRADAVVAVAQAVREHMLRRCGPLRNEIQVIPNGVDVPELTVTSPARETLRSAWNIPDDAFVFGSVGRLAPVKDFGMAIDAIGRLAAQGLPAHFVLVGSGPEGQRLAQQVAEANLDAYVHFVGPQVDVAAWLAVMDAYVNVSLNEGMSQSVLEAMAFGLPVLVTDVGDSQLIVGGEPACGVVVQPGSLDSVTKGFVQLRTDAAWCHELRERALHRFAERYRISTMVETYEDLYADQLGAGVYGSRPAAVSGESKTLR